MKVAILFRGLHYKNIGDGSHETAKNSFNFLTCWPSAIQKIINPLKEHKNLEIELFAVTYKSPISNSLTEFFHKNNILFIDQKSNNQLTCIAKALDHFFVHNSNKFDLIVILRFDLVYKKNINNWFNTDIFSSNFDGVYVTWKERETLWSVDHRVGDTIYLISGNNLQKFINAINKHITIDTTTMHMLYDLMLEENININFICDGYYDSNTSYPKKDSKNPIYVIDQRPYHYPDKPEYYTSRDFTLRTIFMLFFYSITLSLKPYTDKIMIIVRFFIPHKVRKFIKKNLLRKK